MLGIIIGVVSVITAVSLGEGVKNQVAGQIGRLGHELITVHPGNLVKRDESGKITGVNLLSTLGRGTLSEEDYQAVKKSKNVKEAVPLSLVTGVPKSIEKKYHSATIIATTDSLPDIINQELEYGSFFNGETDNGKSIAIGRSVALNLFGENAPIGKSIIIRKHEFVVGGVFERFESNPINPTLDLNNAIFIPFDGAKDLTGSTQIFQILVETNNPDKADETVNSIHQSLKANHSGEEDFTVLKQDETLAVAKNVVSMVTGLVAGIAAISLIIGGIGIMNIMLVSVSERKQEIGIRKAIGATNSQIMYQFLIEGIVLSVWGAMLGLIVAGLGNITIRIFTDFKPVITWQVVVIATFVAIAVGIIFGLAPAVRAAIKDPIDTLRNM
jgi:ABC-type antimicrobial peptide transport system permease subunit